jgi:4-hydroxy-4-methyl-2-oxoglutarate aldolase
MVHKALTLVKPGDVLVIYAHGFCRAGLWGELTSLIAKVAGVAGVIIDGGIRDTERIIEMGLPVWSRSVHAGGTDKNGAGSINVPIVFGGMSIEPGDIIVADSDGITAVPRIRALEVLETAKAREAAEEKSKEQILQGQTLYETYNMKLAFDQLKIEVVEGSFNREV